MNLMVGSEIAIAQGTTMNTQDHRSVPADYGGRIMRSNMKARTRTPIGPNWRFPIRAPSLECTANMSSQSSKSSQRHGHATDPSWAARAFRMFVGIAGMPDIFGY